MRKHTFVGLDGLRGVAALAVVIYHCTGESYRLAGAGYAAVDFFFALSGFVLAHSYDRRLGTMGFAGFMRQRLVRLYPLYLVGTLAGFVVLTWMTGFFDVHAPSVWLALLCGLFFLPAPGWHDPFPFNNPAWSLFWELVVNALYGMKRRPTRTIVLLSLACGLLYLGLVLVFRRSFGATEDGFIVGLPRVMFSFFAGVAVHRLWEEGRLPSLRVPATALAAFLFCYLVASYKPLNGPQYLLFTFVLSPLLLAIAVQNEPGERSKPVFAWLGVTSYGVYVLHAPIRSAIELAFGTQDARTAILTIIASFLAAHVLTAWFDEPVRRTVMRLLHARDSRRAGRTANTQKGTA